MYARTLSLALLVILSVHGAGRAAAQHRGVYLVAGPSHVSIGSDSDEGRRREWGGSLFVRGGYNLVPWAGLFVEGSRGSIAADGDHFSLRHGEVGVHLALADAVLALVPYLEVAYSRRHIRDRLEHLELEEMGLTGAEAETVGEGVTGAAGVGYFLTPRLAVDLGFRYTSGEFHTLRLADESFTVGDGPTVTTTRLSLGLAWHRGGWPLR